MEAKSTVCQRAIDYIFSHPTNILTALNMAGSGNGSAIPFQQRYIIVAKNTRLAVYGDSVAHSHLCNQWIRTELDKGAFHFLLRCTIND
jgi:hypothetical protein